MIGRIFANQHILAPGEARKQAAFHSLDMDVGTGGTSVRQCIGELQNVRKAVEDTHMECRRLRDASSTRGDAIGTLCGNLLVVTSELEKQIAVCVHRSGAAPISAHRHPLRAQLLSRVCDRVGARNDANAAIVAELSEKKQVGVFPGALRSAHFCMRAHHSATGDRGAAGCVRGAVSGASAPVTGARVCVRALSCARCCV